MENRDLEFFYMDRWKKSIERTGRRKKLIYQEDIVECQWIRQF